MAKTPILTPEQAAMIKARLIKGEFQHRIAADFDVNQGRISEIANGKRFAYVAAADMGVNHG